MILQCPECDTKYMVPDLAIGLEGRRVRCKLCKHQWFVEAEIDDSLLSDFPIYEEEVEAQPIPEGSALPVLSTPASRKSWVIAAAILAIIASALLFYQARSTLYGVLAPLYQAVGYYPTDQVVLADVTLEKLPSRRMQRYIVRCNIINEADSPRRHPNLAMKIISPGGNVLAKDDKFIDGNNRILAAGEIVPCGNLELGHSFASADRLVMDIGSPVELSLRADYIPKAVND